MGGGGKVGGGRGEGGERELSLRFTQFRRRVRQVVAFLLPLYIIEHRSF